MKYTSPCPHWANEDGHRILGRVPGVRAIGKRFSSSYGGNGMRRNADLEGGGCLLLPRQPAAPQHRMSFRREQLLQNIRSSHNLLPPRFVCSVLGRHHLIRVNLTSVLDT